MASSLPMRARHVMERANVLRAFPLTLNSIHPILYTTTSTRLHLLSIIIADGGGRERKTKGRTPSGAFFFSMLYRFLFFVTSII